MAHFIKQTAFFIVFGLLIGYISAQVLPDKKEYDFGVLQDWSNNPAIFELQNMSNEPMAILNVYKNSNIHIKYPRTFIQPGNKAVLYIYFEPEKLGRFDETIKILTNLSDKTINLRIHGQVNSFLECPSALASENVTVLDFEVEISTVSAINHEPVPKASVTLVPYNRSSKISFKTSGSGHAAKKIRAGLYTVMVEAPGYQKFEENYYLNKNQNKLVIPLIPMEEEENVAGVTEKAKTGKNEEEIKPAKPEEEKSVLFNLEGIVLDRKTGNPINRASVVFSNPRVRFYYKTMKDGKFSKWLYSGNYGLKVMAEGYEVLDSNLFLDTKSSPIEIYLIPQENWAEKETTPTQIHQTKVKKKYISLAGIILDRQSGEPLNRATISFQGEKTKRQIRYRTFADGKFKQYLPSGFYHLSITAEGYKPLELSKAFNDDVMGLKFELQPLETKSQEKIMIPVKVVLAGLDKDRVQGETINLYSPSKDSLFTALTDARGQAEFLLDTGKYILSVQANGFKPFISQLYITSEHKEFHIQLEKDYQPDLAKSVDSLERNNRKVNMQKTEKAEIKNLPDITSEAPSLELSRLDYSSNNLVFLVDVSSSMAKGHKIDMLKTAMANLIDVLREIDLISLITYSTESHLVFSSLPVNRKDSLKLLIKSINPEGLTYGIKGLEKAYHIALENYKPDGNNQVFIATDGEFNSPDYSEFDLMRLVVKYARKGIKLSVIGFGQNKKALNTMKRAALMGGGHFIYISDSGKSQSLLIEEVKKNSRIKK